MKTSIETINGKPYTVIWHKPKGWAESLDCDTRDIKLHNGVIIRQAAYMGTHIATALPALPKHPEEKDVALLYMYLANGLYPRTGEGLIEGYCPVDSDWAMSTGWWGSAGYIDYAVDNNLERVEIAIEAIEEKQQ